MFEFMYANKIQASALMEIIEKYNSDYHLHITYKPNGIIEIFIGSKRSEVEVLDKPAESEDKS